MCSEKSNVNSIKFTKQTGLKHAESHKRSENIRNNAKDKEIYNRDFIETQENETEIDMK